MATILALSVIAIFCIQGIRSTDTVITELGCTTTSTSSTCRYADAVCTTEGYCMGPATCTNTDCSTGPVCPTGEECFQIYNTNTYKCCTWIGSGSNSTTSTVQGTNCVDLAAPGRPSDCPANANLCQNALYKTLMQQQCPKTCGYCTTGTVTSSSTCIDLAAPGRPSDCPSLAHLCNNTLYASVMAQQCRKTCGLC